VSKPRPKRFLSGYMCQLRSIIRKRRRKKRRKGRAGQGPRGPPPRKCPALDRLEHSTDLDEDENVGRGGVKRRSAETLVPITLPIS
jgi:hypothetical protein